jgi:hypothetical protein
MGTPFLLYHWSLTTRRKSINKYGLLPGSKSRCGLWHPPYICFAKSPSFAWALSAMVSENYGEWDLWMTWSNQLNGYEKLESEYRVYHRIRKRDIWHVGTRTYKKRKERRDKK